MPTPLMELPREARRAAKARLVAGMNAGLSWHEAAAAADITVREDTAYRLRRRVREKGDAALDDHRQGVPYKLPPPVRQWIVRESCHTITSADLKYVLATTRASPCLNGGEDVF